VADALRQALDEAHVGVVSVRRIEPTLEDAFFELVRRRRGTFA
jgi:hypothetical protein